MKSIARHRSLGFMSLAAILGTMQQPPPSTPEQAHHRARQRTINNIVYRICTLHESNGVEVNSPEGTITVLLNAADPMNVTPAEADDFQERLEAAFEKASMAKLRAAAAADKSPRPHITEEQLDMFSAATGIPRDKAQAELEKMVGRPVAIGEVKPPEATSAPSRRRGPPPRVHRTRSERSARRKANRR